MFGTSWHTIISLTFFQSVKFTKTPTFTKNKATSCNSQVPRFYIFDISSFEKHIQKIPWCLKCCLPQSGPRCVARFDFEGEHSDELTFSEGDVIQLKAYIGQEWVRGQIGTFIGIFPLNFVEVIEDLPPHQSQQQTESTRIPLPGKINQKHHELVSLYLHYNIEHAIRVIVIPNEAFMFWSVHTCMNCSVSTLYLKPA